MSMETQQKRNAENTVEMDLAYAPSFIERQFPVNLVSMESFAERRSNQSQSITSLGKWWGRKPLVLVRATLVGLLVPATNNPVADREVFLKIMTMDGEGLRRRKDKPIPGKRLIEELSDLPPSTRARFLEAAKKANEYQIRRGLTKTERAELQELVFDRMSYSEKLEYCCRPEEIDGPSQESWKKINEHLGTDVYSLTDLIGVLGQRRFGHRPRVGDAFCGAGSIPFEAARLGCDSYGSDLNPVATLLTWASMNLVGGGEHVVQRVVSSQEKVFRLADKQLQEWGIDANDKGWRIDSILYCTEVLDPETQWKVPLSAHWAVAPTSKVVAKLIPDPASKSYQIVLVQDANDADLEQARQSGTIVAGYVTHPIQKEQGKDPSSLDMIRSSRKGASSSEFHGSGVRLWEASDVIPRNDDVFQERAYAIRWEETYFERRNGEEIEELTLHEAQLIPNLKELIEKDVLRQRTRRHFRAVTSEDIAREAKVKKLLDERLVEWQSKGFIPTRKIEPGYNTSQPIRERGWTYWHHLFTPRQLLIIGLLQSIASSELSDVESRVAVMLSIGRFADWNSKLCRWGTGAARESIGQTFTNQALNTMLTFASKGFGLSSGTWFMNLNPETITSHCEVRPLDARNLTANRDIWITDPPYADAINYHEVSEYFLAWYGDSLPSVFPEWYGDSRRMLAVRGNDHDFRQAMVDCYRRMADHMPSNGVQVVMFTHQDASVWADLATIMWAAGLHVTSAWCIQTERQAAGVREGNYVQGTVLMVLRKRMASEPVFLDEITYKVEIEVRRQLDEMLRNDDDSNPNFTDSDYQLAAYAAALRVLTEQQIEEIDPAREVLRERVPGEPSEVEKLIRNAVKIACDHLVPKHIDRDIWKTYSPSERFYLKGLEVETHGERRSGVYQELARGFGATNYDDLLASTKANETRLKSATEFGKKMLNGDAPFAGSLTRHVLFAIHTISKNGEVPGGLNWLRTELPNYWDVRTRAIVLLDFFGKLDTVTGMEHWKDDCESARLLAGALRNDHG